MLSARRQRQVQVMVKVSGLTCRSVGLVKGENCTGVWRADRGSKLGVGWWGGRCEMEVLLVGTNFQRERLFSKCQSFSADGWYHLRNGCSKTSAALTVSILQMPLQCMVPLHFFFFFPCTLFFWGNFSFKSQIKIGPKILTNPNITRCPDWISNILWYTVFKAIMSIYGHKASFFFVFYLITVSHWATRIKVWVFYLLLSDLASQYVNEGGSSGQEQWGRCISYMARLWAVIC